jgi:uncharacterized damage-inducible protein DinB
MLKSVRYTVCVLALVLTGTSVFAQQPDTQGALVKDVSTLSDKFTGLARVMAGKYDSRPSQGVRSVGDVFNLIVAENNMLAGTLSGSGGAMEKAPAITEPAAMQEALKASYEKVRQALAALSASDLNASVSLFGQKTTKQGAALMIILDQHEHLGQSIAYARANNVVPPWSK